MSLASQRSGLKAQLATVTGIGKILDYVVWTDDWQFIYDHFRDGDRIHVWFIGLAASNPGSFQNGLRKRSYTWNIAGYYSQMTSLESSKTFEEVIDAIMAKLDGISSVGAGITHSAPILQSVQNVVFAEQAAHFASIQVTMNDITALSGLCT